MKIVFKTVKLNRVSQNVLEHFKTTPEHALRHLVN